VTVGAESPLRSPLVSLALGYLFVPSGGAVVSFDALDRPA
jgi:hypothetical protein